MIEDPSDRYSPASAHVAPIAGSSAKKTGRVCGGSPALGSSDRQIDSRDIDSRRGRSGTNHMSAAITR
jgi:hypothetical protein